MRTATVRFVGVAVVLLTVCFSAAPAHGRCGGDCRRTLAAERRTCKLACPKGSPGRACRAACAAAFKDDILVCRAATNPAPPECGATTTTTTSPTTTSTTTTVSTSTSTTTTLPRACVGESAYPVCDGVCPPGYQCGGDFVISPLQTVCACFPVGVTPCGATGYPECGGACLGDEVCQAFHLGPDLRGEARFCACVDAHLDCTVQGPDGMCTNPGFCPAEQACNSQLIGNTEVCGCAAP